MGNVALHSEVHKKIQALLLLISFLSTIALELDFYQ